MFLWRKGPPKAKPQSHGGGDIQDQKHTLGGTPPPSKAPRPVSQKARSVPDKANFNQQSFSRKLRQVKAQALELHGSDLICVS